MRAMAISEAGPTDNFRLIELPDPQPGSREVLVRISHIGINHGDVIRRKRGLFPRGMSPPYILGFEGTGIVAGVGDVVTEFREGDRVAFLVEHGAYADAIAVPSHQVFHVPNTMSDAEAAAVPCTGLTAWYLWELAHVPAGETVLIHGGAGGVGSALLQLGRGRGVRQIATVGSQEKAKTATASGADDVIVYTEADFAARAQEITNGLGVSVIFDCVGRDVTEGNLKILNRGGTWLYYGSASGHAEFPGLSVLMNSLRIQGFVVFDQIQTPAWGKSVESMMRACELRLLRPQIDRVLALDEIPVAHRLIEERTVSGKLVVAIGGTT